ncbi:MAG: hypothetical protein WCG04_02145 [Alphaproteobacteria bacterium]
MPPKTLHDTAGLGMTKTGKKAITNRKALKRIGGSSFNPTLTFTKLKIEGRYYHLSRSAFLAEAAMKFGKTVEREWDV